MRTRTKICKLLSVLLTAAMLITLMPATAFAVGEPPVLQTAVVVDDGAAVELAFDKEMAAPESGSAGFYLVRSDTVIRTVDAAELTGDATKIKLTPASPVKGGEVFYLNYDPGTVAAADTGVLGAIANFAITNDLPYPTVNEGDPPAGMVGEAYTHDFTATGGTGAYGFYCSTGSLPPGLILTSTSESGGTPGQLSGTPTQAGDFTFGITVVDANGAYSDREFTIEITTAAVCEIGGTGYTSLDDALDAVDNGETITLLDDITDNDGLVIDSGKNFVIDLDDKVLTVNNPAPGGIGLTVTGEQTLVYIDDSEPGSAFNVTGANTGVKADGGNVTVTSATATAAVSYGANAVNGGNIQATGDVTAVMGGVSASGAGSTILVNGDVTATGASSFGAYVTGGSEITIDGTLTAGMYYVNINGNAKDNSPEYRADPTTKPGYHTYTDDTSTVWVKIPSGSGTAGWTYRSPLPTANILNAVKYLNGQYMGVGYNGTLITSADGEDWEKIDVGTDTDRFNAIAYGAGKYVIVGNEDSNGYAGRIFTSDDGEDWHESASFAGHEFYDVIYRDGTFVAVGEAGKVVTSSDGETWQLQTISAASYNVLDYRFTSIIYNNTTNLFVATGSRVHTGITNRGVVLTSNDLLTWTIRYTNASNYLNDIAYGGGAMAAVGGQSDQSSGYLYIVSSTDGLNWTSRSVTGAPSNQANFDGIEFDGTQFVAVGHTTTFPNTAFAATSSDGTTWAYHGDTAKPGFSAVASDGGATPLLAAVGSYGNICTSGDGGASWTTQTAGAMKSLVDVAWNGSNLYVAVGLNGTIQTSPDGEVWTVRDSGTTQQLNKVDYAGGRFIAVGKTGTILTSDNGVSWTQKTSGTSYDLGGIAYGEGIYVVTGGTGYSKVVLTSTDGTANWSVSSDSDLYSVAYPAVAYGNGVFLALTQNGSAVRSDDGLDWVQASSIPSTGHYPTDIIYADSKFVAVGGYGEVYLSSDNGASWTIVDSDLDSYSFSIAYGGGNFAAVGQNGKIMASSDGGTTWRIQSSGVMLNPWFSLYGDAEMNGVAAGDNCFVVVGGNGTVYQSDSFAVSDDPDENDVNVARYGLDINDILGPGANSQGNVTLNMNLITSGEKGASISWWSSDTDIIETDGTVTRPDFGAGDQVVYLTASISKGSASDTKDFFVVVKEYPDPDIQAVTEARTALTFDTIKGSNTAANNITSNLNLTTSGINGTTISWASTSTGAITTAGAVTRPASGASDFSVTLTATISKGAVAQTKTFNLTVKANPAPGASIWPSGSELTASGTTATGTVLSWTAVEGVSNYSIYQNALYIGIAAGGANTFTVTGLSPDTEYTFRVQAYKDSEWTTDGPTVTVRTQPAPVAHSITVQNDGYGTGAADPTAAAEGATVTLSSMPNSGYHFKEWQAVSPASLVITDNTFTMPDEDVTVMAVFEADAVTTYTATFNSNGSVYATKTVNAGEGIGSLAWPADPMRSSYIFGGWFTGANGSGIQFTSATPVNATVTVYAKWTYSGGGGGDGGSPSTPSTSETPAYRADVKSGNSTETTLPVTVKKDARTASVDAGSQSLTQNGTVIAVPSISNVDTYSVGIPVSDLSTTVEQGTLTLDTVTGSVTVPSNMLTGVAGISGSKAEIFIGQGDKNALPGDVKDAIGDRPLVQLTLSIDGIQTDWNNPDAPVTVSIPYTPTAAELANPESIVVWYIDGSGNAVCVPNGRYDPESGTVIFDVTHFSDYAVAYNPADFDDVPAGAWYHKAVSFIAAREITTGTGDGKFSPNAKLTRGQLIVMLMKAYEIAPDAAGSGGSVSSPDAAGNFSDAGDTYYTGYLATAKRLGITEGVGNNMFAPEKEITRQEMFTLLYNALNAVGSLPQPSEGAGYKTPDDFSDADQIAPWAKDAIAYLIGKGTVSGSGNRLNPTGTTTRAEMAQVLYNLLGK